MRIHRQEAWCRPREVPVQRDVAVWPDCEPGSLCEWKHAHNAKATKPTVSSSWGWRWINSWSRFLGFGSCFNTKWVYFQGNWKTAKSRLQFDMWSPSGDTFGRSSFAPLSSGSHLLEGGLLVCPLCLVRGVLFLPIHIPTHDRWHFRTPEGLGWQGKLTCGSARSGFERKGRGRGKNGRLESRTGETEARKRTREWRKKRRKGNLSPHQISLDLVLSNFCYRQSGLRKGWLPQSFQTWGGWAELQECQRTWLTHWAASQRATSLPNDERRGKKTVPASIICCSWKLLFWSMKWFPVFKTYYLFPFQVEPGLPANLIPWVPPRPSSSHSDAGFRKRAPLCLPPLKAPIYPGSQGDAILGNSSWVGRIVNCLSNPSSLVRSHGRKREQSRTLSFILFCSPVRERGQEIKGFFSSSSTGTKLML